MKKWIVALVLFLLLSRLQADTLTLSGATLDLTGTSTTSSTYSDALSLNVSMPYAGDVLVVSTFTTDGNNQTQDNGAWRLANGSNYSLERTRYLSNNSDRGLASMVHVFSGLSGGNNTISLQHKVTAGTLITKGVNMVAIPLVTTGNDILNHSLGQLGSTVSTASTSFTDTGLGTSVTVDRSSDNAIMMAASFGTQSGGTAALGEWKLQYKKATDGTWTDAGRAVRRYLSGSQDRGAVTLTWLADGLESGSYETRLLHRSTDGNQISTLSGSLASIALSYTNAAGGGYFPSFAVASAGSAHAGNNDPEPILGASATLNLDEAADIFSMMSYDAYAQTGANQVGSWNVSLTNDLGQIVQSSQESERLFSTSVTDVGAGGAAALFTNVTAGSYSVEGMHDDVTAHIVTTDVNLVGFSTVAIPEPSALFLLGLSGGGFIFIRRRLR